MDGLESFYDFQFFQYFSRSLWTVPSAPTPAGITIIVFTNPSTRVGYDTKSFFKQSLTDSNSEFSFS